MQTIYKSIIFEWSLCNCGKTTEKNVSVIFAYFETYYTNIGYGSIYIIFT
jgi:hypothetical protein